MNGNPAETPCQVHLQLLGSWRLSTHQDGLNVSVDRSCQKLVALLALRSLLTRPQIWATLWPNTPASRASGRLRTILWRLSAQQIPLVASSHNQMSLTDNVHVDVTDFYNATAAIDAGLGSRADHRGIAIFCADLLPDWDEEWLMGERDLIRALRLHALETLSTQLRRESRFGPAIEAALVAVGVDPLRESAHRAVICTHLAQGNAAAALRQFQSCQATYAQELQTTPSSGLYALVAHLITEDGIIDRR